MNLNKALKYKNSVVGEISDIKEKIKKHNSHVEGNVSSKSFDMNNAVERLNELVQILVNLKIAINEANRKLYPIIFLISEYKALISFWKEVDSTEGTKIVGYGEVAHKYGNHLNERTIDDSIKTIQLKVDQLQDEIDEYNLTNSFDWNDTITEE